MAVGRCGRDGWRAAPIARDCPNCQSYQDLMKGAGRADAPAAHVSSGDIFHEHFRLAPLVTDGVRLAGQVGSGSDLMKLADFRSWQILLQKSPTRGGRPAASGFSRTTASPVLPLAPLGAAAWLNPLCNCDPARRLPSIHGGSWRRLRGELGQPAQVLGDRCQGELVLCAAGSAQPQAAELQDALQVGKQHLDALAIAA